MREDRSCRSQPEENSADDAYGRAIGEGAPVHSEEYPVRLADILRGEIEGMHAEDRESEPDATAKATQEHTFEEQLANDLPA
jgi:hypothetical protein